jgi:hypothetical protein
MRMRAALVALVLLSACRSEPPPPYRPVADVKQLMQTVVDPAADVIWGAVGAIVSEKGTEEFAPRNDEEWAGVRNSAYVLAESGNLLMMGARPKDKQEWMRFSQQLVEVGTRAIQAAEAKDKDKVFEVGGELYSVCANCHERYQVKVVEAEAKP